MKKKKVTKTTKKKAVKKTVKKPAKKRGRKLSEVKLIFRKLEPYLKSGFSVNKSCLLAGVTKTVVYDRMKADDNFRRDIDIARAHQSTLLSDIATATLTEISDRIGAKDKKGNPIPFTISKGEASMLRLMIIYKKSVRDEWSDKNKEEEDDSTVQFDKPKTEREAKLQAMVLNIHHDYINKGKAVSEEGD